MATTLELVLLYLVAAVLGVVACRSLKLPPMLGYLVVGVLIGPNALALAKDNAGVKYLAEFGVVFLMFVIGLEFNLPKLRSMRTLVFGLGLAQVLLTVLGTLAGHALLSQSYHHITGRAWEMSWQGALVLGSAMAMSSTAIVVKLMAERLELESEHGKRVLGVLGDFASGPSMAVAEIYAKEGLAQLSQTASHPDFVKISNWQFRNITTQAQEGPYNAGWLKEAGVKNVAVIALQNDWGLSAAENFVKAFEATGGKASVEYFNPGSRDFRSILTKVSRGNPDAIYLCMFYEEGALLLQQARQLGIKSQMFSTSALYAPKLLELGGEAINGLKLSTTFVPDNPAANVRSFVDEYKKRYGQEPNQFAAQAYDAVGIMLEALKRAGPGATRAQLRDQLAATKNYPGVTGATTFDPATREPSKSLARMEVKGGKFVVM
jgi:branched-chain amino acid transport system substrate-binding protein